MIKHILCDCKFKFNSILQSYNWYSSGCICQNSRYLRSVVDDSVIVCDEIINATNSASVNMENTLSKYVISTMSLNSYNKRSKIWNGLLYLANAFISNYIATQNFHWHTCWHTKLTCHWHIHWNTINIEMEKMNAKSWH